MLTGLDETLRHQLPTTFDHVGTSDPRFYDRYWFSCYDPAGELAVIIGMGLYNNMNVLDGFVALQQPHGRNDPSVAGTPASQWNYRFSRSLRPDLDHTTVGPLSVEIIEPFTSARVQIAASPGRDVAADLVWTSFLPPIEEAHHFIRVRGRVAQDYRRYTQVGHMNGTITLGDRTYEVTDWFGARDHSWGVRPAVAGPEPVTGPPNAGNRAATGFVFFWVPFATDELGGHVQIHSLGDGSQVLLDGMIQWPDGTEREVVEASFAAEFFEGSRRWKQVRSHFVDDAGEHYDVVADVLIRDWAMDGTGYDWGWVDGQGLGVWRGDFAEEHEVYDLTDPHEVRRPNGDDRSRSHREAPARVTVNGRPGMGHQILLASGPVPFLGLG
jgi:hypothetical protein